MTKITSPEHSTSPNTTQQNANAFPMASATAAYTHDVQNTPPHLTDHNSFTSDIALSDAVQREGAGWATDALTKLGEQCGSREWIDKGHEANRIKPVLNTHDHYGHRIDEVIFHPAYHDLMALSKSQGLTGSPWVTPQQGAHVARAAGSFLMTQVEAGHCCPITMSFAAVPTLLKQASIAEEWLPKVLNTHYDPSNVSHTKKQSVTLGMAMTEKQGGSDVRQNSTRAFPIGKTGPGEAYELVGHKFFVSAPMSDAFLTLAYAEQGMSCFLVPRWRPDGVKNPLQLIRLKDKMGNVSNASSETELRGAFGWLIGEEGRGIANILEMVALTRFDCLVASAAGMRQHMTQIVHHTRHRVAFGKPLAQQSLMQNVLADLNLEAEAATLMAFRIARSLDATCANDEAEQAFNRLATAVGKYWICKRQPEHAYEALECIGGSAIMENSIMPRLYREAPINTIWEGSGNVQCLDVLRVIQKHPESLTAFIDECTRAKGMYPALDKAIAEIHTFTHDPESLTYRARHFVKHLAITLQASLMVRFAPNEVADAFCASRLESQQHHTYGMLPKGLNCSAIIARAY